MFDKLQFMLNIDSIISFLKATSHEELIPQVRKLNSNKLQNLINQIFQFQKRPLHHFKYCLPPLTPSSINPPSSLFREGDPLIGNEAIKNGKVHAIILAGGSGSRLKFDKPKALFPLFQDKTLLQLLEEQVPSHLDLTILATQEGAKQINRSDMIIQSELPYLTHDYKWKLNHDGTLLCGPDGNGALLHILKDSGKIELWKKQGIETVIILNVDNPLLPPYDPHLLGVHLSNRFELTVKGYAKDESDKKVGSFATYQDKLHIIDYNDSDIVNSLKYGNTNHMCLSIDFLERICSKVNLPFHWVNKTTHFNGEDLPIFKGEQFITDIAPLAKSSGILICDKKSSFSPVKSQEGIDQIRARVKNLLNLRNS
ncbi:MAG: UTP--glucose-1-phosphate uridylyltransferase [Rhabdochlamydiaceae bacterium]|nr:UTP--glucose-1-phosphate uridylyltransferase [Candidatus Amphrikana amoebophyrae]